jgi:hypothetical protein
MDNYLCTKCFNTTRFYISCGNVYCYSCDYGSSNVIIIDDSNRKMIELLYK